MRGYAVAPAALLADGAAIGKWIDRSVKFVASLPEKGPQKATKKATTKSASRGAPKRPAAKRPAK
jgi:hypothetical protein